MSNPKRHDRGQTFYGVRAIIAAALLKKSHERFNSKKLPALDEDTRVTTGRERETLRINKIEIKIHGSLAGTTPTSYKRGASSVNKATKMAEDGCAFTRVEAGVLSLR